MLGAVQRTEPIGWPWDQTWDIVVWFAVGVVVLFVGFMLAGALIGTLGDWGLDGPGDGAAVGVAIGFVASLVAVVVCVIVVVWAGLVNVNEQKKTQRGLGDGPRPTRIDGRRVDGVVEMADNFPNVATKCVWEGWRAFVTSNGDHLAVVPDDACRFRDTGPSD